MSVCDDEESSWRRLPGSGLPERLDRAIRQVFEIWHEDMALPDVGLDRTPIDLEHDAGKHAPALTNPPHWNGRVPFSLWYVWEWGYKVPGARTELRDAALGLAQSSAYTAHDLPRALWGLHGCLVDLRLDWYECAPYIAGLRFLVDMVGRDYCEDRDPTAVWFLGEVCEEAAEDAGALTEQWQAALAGLSRLAPDLDWSALGSKLARFEAQIIRGSHAISKFGDLRITKQGDSVRELRALLFEIEASLASSVQAALACEDTVALLATMA